MPRTSQPPTSRKAEFAHPTVFIRACESRVAVQASVSGWSIQEDLRVAVFNSVIRFRFVKLSLLVLSVLFAGSLAAQSLDQQVAERLKPIGEVCLAGQACASGGAAPAAQVAAATGEFSAEQVYTQNCAMCHATGMAGAPKFGDADAWSGRIAAKGFETVVKNSITGINAMPAKGMCMTCTDENMTALVEYISGQAQ
jgi:cytochrome c5